MDTPTTFADRRWTSTDGLQLYARDYPAIGEEVGLPVICLHGLTRNARDFEDLAPLIAQWGRRVVVPDVRGRGRSDHDPDPRRYQPRTYARDVAAMLDSLAIPRAIFIGTSMGALITMALVGSRPKAIAAAIINDAGPIIAPEGIERILAYAGKPDPVRTWAEAADYARKTNGAALPGLDDGAWDRVAGRLFRDGENGPVLDYDPAIARVIGQRPPRLAGWIATFLFKRLARGRRLMLIRGAQSDIITAEIAERMQRMAPSLECIAVPGVGHAPMLDEPEAVDAIARFLRTVP
jgi:pimeloyl-ACP methyl ester carboxylesterase